MPPCSPLCPIRVGRYYEAGQDGTDNGVAIWTNAHVCQFTQVGWKYVPVGKGSGMLANGGSYVSMVS